MIHVFFDPGSFGSTIEYVIRNHSDHVLGPIDANISIDGSMHLWKKQYHLKDTDTLKTFLNSSKDPNGITTPFYPFKEFKFPTIVNHVSTIPTWNDDTKILIYHGDERDVELNLLFKYHKICNGHELKMGLDIITGDQSHDLKMWNTEYTHWHQMHPWQLREWISLFYADLLNNSKEAQNYVDSSWLKISNTDILYNTKDTLEKIISFCNLKIVHPLDMFVDKWQKSQQYIVDEFNLINQIVYCTINNTEFFWEPINIVAESIIQKRLRDLGYEIKCDGLNIFPTDSKTLHKLLKKFIHMENFK